MAGASPLSIFRASASTGGATTLAGRISEFLTRHEAENNLPLSILADIETGRYSDFDLLLAADAAGVGQAALVWTRPHNLLLCYGDEPAARGQLLEALLSDGTLPPGVTGPEPAAGEVAAWLVERPNVSGSGARRVMRQGIYRLTEVRPATDSHPRPTGTVREALPDEAGTFVPWLGLFAEEADPTLGSGAELWRRFQHSDARRLWVFEAEGRPVSLAGVGGSTPNGRRIGPVFTPRENRRRGYAEALVARVSQDLLDAGARFCFLYTDLDNPTANEVYRRIGYEMVAESGMYRLDQVGARGAAGP